MPKPLRIGIDIGGTFTDFVVYDPDTETIETFKLLSTPENPAKAVMSGLHRLDIPYSPDNLNPAIIHGSTVATNALLERQGASTALVTTRGFSDLLQIGRQNRPELYNLNADPPPPLVPQDLRFEVDERVDSQGQVLKALNPDEVQTLKSVLIESQASSVAVCLLFSFLHPQHEIQIVEQLRSAGFSVSASCEILPEYREYERASTTTVNAYVSPILERYLSYLEQTIGEPARLRVMQSNGGTISLNEARRNGVRCILSGPAGGVVGARFVASLSDRQSAGETGQNSPLIGFENAANGTGLRVIGFDMGGTSTDVSLIDGDAQVTTEAVVGGCPIRIPVLDIHTIGAGGGSIAMRDAGGALRVGPKSAGADPGPACYGKGELATVTDANLVLGRIAPEHFLGGQMSLDTERAHQALSHLGQQLGLDPIQAALGVIEVVNAHMERALRVISVERGHDPRLFTLLSFGGAGGLHAADLARRLSIPYLLVPPMASTLSAFGMLAADVVKDYTQTVMLPGDISLPEIEKHLAPLIARGVQDLTAEGVEPAHTFLESSLDMRYIGQSYEINIPISQTPQLDFYAHHQQVYGYSRSEAPTEIVNVRVKAIGKIKPPTLKRSAQKNESPEKAFLDHRQVAFAFGQENIPFYRGETLQAGNRLIGPAIIVRSDTTILINPGDQAVVDSLGNLMISFGT